MTGAIFLKNADNMLRKQTATIIHLLLYNTIVALKVFFILPP